MPTLNSNGTGPRSPERNAARMLAVAFALSNGDTSKSFTREDLFAECRKLNLFNMSDTEFEAYRFQVASRLGLLARKG